MLSLVPLAVAAGNGVIDGLPARQLVAAGFALLQRSVPLVRALSGRRAGILLPGSPQLLTALAASDGRGALLMDPVATAAEIAEQLDEAGVGAVFTFAALADRLPDTMPRVLLDRAPRQAQVIAGETTTVVDLGSHVGLSIEGEVDVPGRDEECVLVCGSPLTHRDLLDGAPAMPGLPHTHPYHFLAGAIGPLRAGAQLTTARPSLDM